MRVFNLHLLLLERTGALRVIFAHLLLILLRCFILLHFPRRRSLVVNHLPGLSFENIIFHVLEIPLPVLLVDVLLVRVGVATRAIIVRGSRAGRWTHQVIASRCRH